MSTKTLRLSDDLVLPLDAVTQTFLIVGKRGSGKSNTAARFVEQLYRARLPFVVLDPVDTWWGLKANREGAAGLGVYVFGGRHQDIPLEPGGGALIAEVLCEHRQSMVLSVKHLSGRARSAFMVQFAQTLFQKWQGGPLHVVLEEAHELAPQMSGGRGNTEDGDAAMLGAFKRLWKLGRASGIGGTAVTQRPASLSKDITTQSEILIAHRTIGPQDVKAIGEWVKYHGEHADLLADLPSLPTGEAFAWAPEFPEGKPIGLRRVRVLQRETYDSAATPKVGETIVEPKELAAVDLDALRSRMAATIERAKADDPKELRKELARVRQELTQAKSQPVAAPTPALTQDDRRLLERVAETLLTNRAELDAVLAKLAALQSPTPTVAARPSAQTVRPSLPPRSHTTIGVEMLKGERAILTALAHYSGGRTKVQIAVLTGYAVNGGGFNNYLGALRTRGWIAGSDPIAITGAGVDALGPLAPLPTGADLRSHWRGQLGKAELAIFDVVCNAYPNSLDKIAIGEQTGYEPNGGGFNNALGRLRTLELINRGAAIRANEDLF